ncbi:unnamed protein product, partial [Musa banksii]
MPMAVASPILTVSPSESGKGAEGGILRSLTRVPLEVSRSYTAQREASWRNRNTRCFWEAPGEVIALDDEADTGDGAGLALDGLALPRALLHLEPKPHALIRR